MTKFCPQCGASHPDTAKFCQQCGASIENAPVKEVTESGTAGEPAVGSTLEPASEAKARKTLKVADALSRIIAFIIDIIFIGILSWLLTFVGFPRTSDYLLFSQTPPFVTIISWPLYFLNAVKEFVLGILYFGLLETLNKGQTLGKALFSLQSVGEKKGEPVGGKQAFLNAIMKSHIILLLVDLLIGLLSQQKPNLKQIRLVQRLTGEVIIKKNA